MPNGDSSEERGQEAAEERAFEEQVRDTLAADPTAWLSHLLDALPDKAEWLGELLDSTPEADRSVLLTEFQEVLDFYSSDFRLTKSALRVLKILNRNSALMTQLEIEYETEAEAKAATAAERLGKISLKTIGRIVGRLDELGFIGRAGERDGVTISEKGKRYLSKLPP